MLFIGTQFSSLYTVCVCVFVTAVLVFQYILESCSRGGCVFITTVTIIKLYAWGEGDSGGHVQR